jgi:hypothetical protein
MNDFVTNLRKSRTGPRRAAPLNDETLHQHALSRQYAHAGGVLIKAQQDLGDFKIGARTVRIMHDRENGGIGFDGHMIMISEVPNSMLADFMDGAKALEGAIDRDQVAMARDQIQRAVQAIASHQYLFAEIKMPSGKGRDTEATRKPSRQSQVNTNESDPKRGGMYATNVEATGRRS